MKSFRLASMIIVGVISITIGFTSKTNAQSSTFIKKRGDARIYQIKGSTYCQVDNMEHLRILRGTNFQEFSPQAFRTITSNASYGGKCRLPSGFYKSSNEPEIYMIRGNYYCWVTDMGQYERLKNKYGYPNFRRVSDVYSITRIHKSTGACRG